MKNSLYAEVEIARGLVGDQNYLNWLDEDQLKPWLKSKQELEDEGKLVDEERMFSELIRALARSTNPTILKEMLENEVDPIDFYRDFIDAYLSFPQGVVAYMSRALGLDTSSK